MMKTLYTIAALLISNISWAQKIEKSTIQNQFELTGDVLSFPLTIVNAFPFISGEVNGIKGKFMFDTGHPGALDINIVPLPSLKEIGEAKVGSGQKYKKYANATIKDLHLANGLHFQNIEEIEVSNSDFLQNRITPDFIGFIGYKFSKGYLFKLDYTKRKLTFYKNTPMRESSKDFLAGEKVVAILDFETRNRPGVPMMKVKVNNVKILAAFDTGAYGGFDLTDKDTEKLKREKHLLDYGKDGYDEDLFVLNNVNINGQLNTNLIGLDKFGEISHLRKSLGITEDNFLLFGYRFLAQYKTVWDYDHKKIYVLKY